MPRPILGGSPRPAGRHRRRDVVNQLLIILSTITFALLAGATLAMVAVSRAPGWEKVRIVAGLTATAAIYASVNAASFLMTRTRASVELVTSINFSIAALHVAGWVWYTFSDESGRWASLALRWRWLVAALAASTLAVTLTGHAITDSAVRMITVPALGVSYPIWATSAWSQVPMAVIVVALALCLRAFHRRWRAGEPGAGAQLAGFVVFFVFAFEEVLVSVGLVDFIWLAEFGFLALVLPVSLRMLERFVADARRLQVLTSALSAEVEVVAEERDAAREALAAQARFAALGRMAGGVGHEINNPLQVLLLHLEELRDAPLREEAPGAREALEQSIAAAERIGRIVAGMRAYATPSTAPLEHVRVDAVVPKALELAAAQLQRVGEVRTSLGPVPPVLADRERLTQAVVHALTNAALAVEWRERGEGWIEVRTRTSSTGDAMLEITDNGRGYPEAIRPHLGEPFVTTRAGSGSAGLGIFFIRGVVDAHGGALDLEDRRGGGAVLRIVLPPAVSDGAAPPPAR